MGFINFSFRSEQETSMKLPPSLESYNLYALLGVKKFSSLEEIKGDYRKPVLNRAKGQGV